MSKSSVPCAGLEATGLAAGPFGRRLFSNVNLKVATGEALRVVGPNGSGKTTLLRTLCGLAEPLTGAVTCVGRVAYIGHAPALKDDLTALENLKVSAALAGLSVSDLALTQALVRLGVGARAHVLGRSLSQGQRRRVTLARLALTDAAEVLILDEPFTALDAEAIAVLSGVLEARLAAGSALVYTTHQVHPLASRCEHVLTLGQAGAQRVSQPELA